MRYDGPGFPGARPFAAGCGRLRGPGISEKVAAMKRLIFSLLGGFALTLAAHAGIHTEAVTYDAHGTKCQGWVAFDDTQKGPRPGVLIVHQWTGLTDYEKKRARMLAELGYSVFCADIYGADVKPPLSPKDAPAAAGKYKGDRALYRARLTAAFDQLKKRPETDPKKLAAIGYCFGGTGVLELARSGADARGVVSFHGGLSSPTPADARKIGGRALVLHGADDPFVPPAEVAAFRKEMDDAKVKYQFVAYPGAVHAFTQEMAGNDNSKGAAYNKDADTQSWAAMQKFFKEIFQ